MINYFNISTDTSVSRLWGWLTGRRLFRSGWAGAGLVALGMLQAFAQPEQEIVNIRFSPLAWDRPIRDLWYFDGDTPVRINVPNGAPGRSIRYRGPRDMAFYRVAGVDAEGETLYAEEASLRIPDGHGEWLLIFVKYPHGDGYRILPVLTDPDEFGGGAFNFYNLTPSRVALRLGDQRFILGGGDNRVVNTGTGELGNIEVQIAASSQQDDWRPLYQSRWGQPGEQRRIWVFIHNVDGNTPQIKRYYQAVRD